MIKFKKGSFADSIDSYYWLVFWVVWCGSFTFKYYVDGLYVIAIFHAVLLGAFINMMLYKNMVDRTRRSNDILHGLVDLQFKEMITQQALLMEIDKRKGE